MSREDFRQRRGPALCAVLGDNGVQRSLDRATTFTADYAKNLIARYAWHDLEVVRACKASPHDGCWR